MCKHDLVKSIVKTRPEREPIRDSEQCVEKRPTKESYKRDLQKRPTKETYKRDLQTSSPCRQTRLLLEILISVYQKT